MTPLEKEKELLVFVGDKKLSLNLPEVKLIRESSSESSACSDIDYQLEVVDSNGKPV